MNYFKIVILSLLLSIHCGIQSSTLDDSDNDFFDDGALDQLIDRYIHYYEAEDQNYQYQNILDQNNDMSQVSDYFDADNAMDNNFQDQQQDQQNNNYLIIPSQAGKKAYSQTEQGKAADEKRKQKRIAQQNGGVASSSNVSVESQIQNLDNNADDLYGYVFDEGNAMESSVDNNFQDQQNNHNLITPYQAGKQAYDDVYRQLYKIDEPDDSENNKYAIAQAEKARMAAYNRVYRQLTKSKDVMEKREQKRRAIQHGGIPTIEGQHNNDLIIAKEAGQQAYDDVYSQLRKIGEPDDSENNKYARIQAEKARKIAYKKIYRQTDKGKAINRAHKKKYLSKERAKKVNLKRIAQQNGGVALSGNMSVESQIQNLDNNADDIYGYVFDEGNAMESLVDNNFQDEQNNNDLITSIEAGQQAYDDVYRQLYKIDEPDDSENNKKAIALATKARSLAYNRVYRQTDKGKAINRAYQKKYLSKERAKKVNLKIIAQENGGVASSSNVSGEGQPRYVYDNTDDTSDDEEPHELL